MNQPPGKAIGWIRTSADANYVLVNSDSVVPPRRTNCFGLTVYSEQNLSRIATTVLVWFVGSDWKMKARLGKIVFEVSVWVAVIVSPRGGL